MIYRYVFDDLQVWLHSENPKCLVFRGARQVGKTTAVRNIPELLKGEIGILQINLEEYPELATVFSSNDANRILEELSFIASSVPTPGNIVFLDEIQAIPAALQAMRYLREHRPDLRFIAAGSLLETELESGKISVPVGRMEYLFLGPLTFEEFLVAHSGTTMEVDLLKNWLPGKPFPEVAHKKLLNYLRKYLVVGGMPEAVTDYISSGSTTNSSRIHASILNTYRDDFAKYSAGNDLLVLRKVFDWVSARAGDKVIYSKVCPGVRAKKVSDAIDLLSSARVIFPVTHSSGNGLPLGSEVNRSIYKLFFLDVGLMAHMTGISRITEEQIRSDNLVNNGKLAEQFIAQHLLFNQPSWERPALHYWLREKRSSNAEVDFLVQNSSRVIPIEVKAGKAGSMKSLMRFMQEKDSSLAVRFDNNFPSLQKVDHKLGNGAGLSDRVTFDLLSLPLYMVGEMDRILSTLP